MTDGTSSASTPDDPDDRSGPWSWLLPALTFLAGAALASILFVVGDSDDSGDAVLGSDDASPTETTDPTSSPSPDPEELVIEVPSACVEAAELAESVTTALGDVVDAAGALDARRLQESLDVVQAMRPDVEAASQECRDLAANGRIVTPPTSATTAPSPTATSTPTS